jgi:hypothetical protein
MVRHRRYQRFSEKGVERTPSQTTINQSNPKFNKELNAMQKAENDNGAAKKPETKRAEPRKLRKRIVSTTYEVSIHFSETLRG